MFEAKEIDFETIEPEEVLNNGSSLGRGFAVSGGVAGAVAEVVKKEHPELELKTARAEGLRDCKKLMALAKAGKYNGYLLEGMACPGGCIAGAGTLLPVEQAAKIVGAYQKEASTGTPEAAFYHEIGHDLEHEE